MWEPMKPAPPEITYRKCSSNSPWYSQSRMIFPTWPEVLLLLTLAGVSVFLFWRRLGPVVDTIRRSKPDPGIAPDAGARRVRDFVWEVLLQGKVIGERPLPGLAHAFVFWGFLAFALVTVNHFAIGFGVRLLSPHGLFGSF